ncbi:MAG: ABC transporter ATP-binding protein [Acidimicrobiia bacterium]|nr:ABC transporter ATP-binding protein [Acidimicrobiia bacterium]MDQ3499472.1 ABC transporter ATP-binding protein [Actinomycetota bacterium]
METLVVESVVKSYGSTLALSGVTLKIAPGVTGLLGPNGAGKTTLLRCLATGLAPDSGDIRIMGRDPRITSDLLEIRRRLGYMPQDDALYSSLTCFEYLEYMALLKEQFNRAARRAHIDELLAEMGLQEKRTSKVRRLSGGMRRRLMLAQALLGRPQVLLLDEPSAGLDPAHRLHFRSLITTGGESRTVLLSTHVTDDVEAMCDAVYVIDRGLVLFQGTPSQLSATAVGRVWISDVRTEGGQVTWRTGDGLYRSVGVAPDGATLVNPTIEDAYLLLVGQAALN